ncbi:MAG: hypothetical protein ACJ8F0_21095 [Xanthobacteraceae bacterium]
MEIWAYLVQRAAGMVFPLVLMGGIYAAEMAQRGIIGLAIDYRNFGESGGEPRQYDDSA